MFWLFSILRPKIFASLNNWWFSFAVFFFLNFMYMKYTVYVLMWLVVSHFILTLCLPWSSFIFTDEF